MVEIVSPTVDHVREIYENAREADQREMDALGITVRDALEQGMQCSDWCFTMIFDGKVGAMFGITTWEGNGVPWLLGTDVIRKFPKSFHDVAQRYVRRMREEYPVLTNFVHQENGVSRSFLAHLGFEFAEPEPYGPKEELFLRFSMEGLANV